MARWVLAFARSARRADAVVVRGTSGAAERYRDLLAAAAIRFVAPRTRVVVSDATLEPRSRRLAGSGGVRGRLARIAVPVLARALVRLVDSPWVTWCVLSRAEVDRFPGTWRTHRGRVVFTPFRHAIWNELGDPPATGGHLFSGGNSLRDHALLAAAVSGLDIPVVIATTWSPPTPQPNLRTRSVTPSEYLDLIATSRGVVLCLESGARSTAQQTYLNAMALGRPTIVTDSDGVRDHLEDGVTGVVVPSTVEAVRAAVLDLLDPARAGHYAAMGERARLTVRARFSDHAYRMRLLDLADGAADSATSGVLPNRVQFET